MCELVVDYLRKARVQVVQKLRLYSQVVFAPKRTGINYEVLQSFYASISHAFTQPFLQINSVVLAVMPTIHSTNNDFNKGNVL